MLVCCCCWVGFEESGLHFGLCARCRRAVLGQIVRELEQDMASELVYEAWWVTAESGEPLRDCWGSSRRVQLIGCYATNAEAWAAVDKGCPPECTVGRVYHRSGTLLLETMEVMT